LFGTHYAYLPAPTSASLKIRKKGKIKTLLRKNFTKRCILADTCSQCGPYLYMFCWRHDIVSGKKIAVTYFMPVFYPGFVSRPRGEVGVMPVSTQGWSGIAPQGGGLYRMTQKIEGQKKNLTTKKPEKIGAGLPFFASWFFKHVVIFHICLPPLGHTWGVPLFFIYLYYFFSPPPLSGTVDCPRHSHSPSGMGGGK